jgi:ribulose-5-phosphate 4-epimerase/fuculose-1-phosphate aldolase
MKRLTEKYAAKLAQHGLCEAGEALVGGRNDRTFWSSDDPRRELLEPLFEPLGVNSLLLARPAEPYRTIIDFLAGHSTGAVTPRDCETRTFLHEIPVCSARTDLETLLRERKAVIVPGQGVVAKGTVSPEECFVYFSSVCFACFVLFFSDHLHACRHGGPNPDQQQAFDRAVSLLPEPRTNVPALTAGPFMDEAALLAAMAEAGRNVVGHGLVDSFFGNISCLRDGIVHISQTGSSLDELEGCIDPCPQDRSTCAGLTASSELSAHEDAYRRTHAACILHGHPKFTVIMSMDCPALDNCPDRHRCHTHCTKTRLAAGLPVVPGEVGTGPTGLCHTLPPALENAPGAIVHGHGLFATGTIDFNAPFATMLHAENQCREEYFNRVREAIHG